MYLPTDDAMAPPEFLLPAGRPSDGLKNGGWDSLIGVVTAICGNILISFALNTQRYAHIRLSRDQEEHEKRRRARRREVSRQASYGTPQREGAEERAERNTKAEGNGYPRGHAEGCAETDPLLPRRDIRKTSGSSSGSAASEEEVDDEEKAKSYLQSPIWWAGIVMMVIGEIGNFLAYGFAPASIVSPLGVVALVSNCLIAPLLLGETFRVRDGLGVLIAIGGCVVVVLSASSSNPKLSPKAIWGLVTTWEFETYLGITLFLIIVLLAASNKYGHKTILIDLGLVGLFGGYTALSTKGVASLLTYSIWRVVTFPITYLLLAVLILTAVMQIKYVNRALQRFNSTMVIPTQFVMFTLSVIIGSAVLYRDFEREKAEDAGKFVAGCALTFFGVWCITSGRSSKDDTESHLDEVDGIGLVDDEAAIPEIRENDEPAGQESVATTSSGPPMRRLRTANGSLPSSITKTPTFGPIAGTTPSGALDLTHHLQDADLAPGTTAAVHVDSLARLHGNGGTTIDPPKPPPIHATTSLPIVPQLPKASDVTLRPQTPLNRTPSSPAGGRPSPSRTSPVHRATNIDPASAARRLQERHSVLGLFPGPLTSPLSGSLAAIVADELRRTNSTSDRSPSGTIRRKSFKSRRPTADQDGDVTKPIISSRLMRHSIASGTEIDFETEEAADVRVAAGSPSAGGGRVRSLSATLGEIFGSGSSSSNTLRRQRTIERASAGGSERKNKRPSNGSASHGQE